MGVTPARAAALRTLDAVGSGRLLDAAFAKATRTLPPRDRAWVRECVYGTLRLRGRLDRLLDHHLHKGAQSVSRQVLDVLRLGAYQILHMAVPAYAAVEQTVELARARAGAPSAGLVNAVLRSVARTGEDPTLFPDRTDDPVAYLASWQSHPAWLVERWLSRWPLDEVESLLESNNRVPDVYLRPLGPSVSDALEALGVGAEVAPLGECVRLPPGMSPPEALERVRGIIQDPAAAAVTTYAELGGCAVVADLCAAPGGKAVALAESVGYVLATDRSRARLARLVETDRRLGSGVGVAVARAEDPAVDQVDGVLADVPCSGTGTLRRHPDLKWRLQPASLGSLVRAQRAILDGAARAVSPGGVLVYATCTLEPEENEEQVHAFLSRRPDFELAPPAAARERLPCEGGLLAVLPHVHGCDGSFAARLHRRP